MKPSVLAVALPVALLSASSALAPNMCVVAGNLAIMGANMIAVFDVQAGQGRMSDIHPHGTLRSSEISQRAQHGIVTILDKDTWSYEPALGYCGSDGFAIPAQG